MMRVRLPRLATAGAALPAGALVAAAAGLVVVVAEAVLPLVGAVVAALLADELWALPAAGGAAGAAGLQAAAPTRPSNASVVASREGCTRESSCPEGNKNRPRAKKSRRVIEISRA